MDPIFEAYNEAIVSEAIKKGTYTLKSELNAENTKVANDYDFEKGTTVIVSKIKGGLVYFKADDDTKNNSWVADEKEFKSAVK